MILATLEKEPSSSGFKMVAHKSNKRDISSKFSNKKNSYKTIPKVGQPKYYKWNVYFGI